MGTARRVALGDSSVEGVVDGAVLRARGIRYARAERGRPPVAVVDPGPQRSVACPQPVEDFTADLMGFDPLAELPRDEDCLRLSVAAPADLAPGEALPVMVWLHGGGYRTGAGDSAAYDPTALVTEGRVVVVTVTYRLGAFGFLRTPTRDTANLGLLDVLEALRWVRAHIGALGGDPSAVTLFGQSSGADLIVKLMTLEETGALVARVALQSAPLGIQTRPAALDAAILGVADEVLARVGDGDVAGGYALVDAAARPFGLRGSMPFSAEWGRFPLDPESLALTRAPRFDVLIGYTAEETRFFLPILRELVPAVTLPVLGGLLARLMIRVTSEFVYGKGNRRFARSLARGGAQVTTYVLQSGRGGAPIGAGHTVDLGLLFPLPTASARERADGAVVRAAWLEFARTGRVTSSRERRRVLRLSER